MHARPTPRRVAAMAKQRRGSLHVLCIPSCLACVLPAPCSRTTPPVAPQPGLGRRRETGAEIRAWGYVLRLQTFNFASGARTPSNQPGVGRSRQSIDVSNLVFSSFHLGCPQPARNYSCAACLIGCRLTGFPPRRLHESTIQVAGRRVSESIKEKAKNAIRRR
jgi:hypothetical protein